MIIIIGAGPGGLTLASVLNRHGVAVEIYDADLSASSRHQGGMLDLHQESGQAALEAAGLLPALDKLVLENGDDLRILEKTGALLLEAKGNGLRPEVERGALRQLLLSSLPPETVHWNARLAEVTRTEHGFRLVFADRRVATASILIGADGAGSKVRPLVCDAVPTYTGVSFVELRYRDVERLHPKIAALVGRGLMFALSEGRGLIAHREPNDAVCLYAELQVPLEWTKQPLSRNALRDHFADWHADFHELLATGESDLRPRSISILPVGHSWPRASGVTLLGDAAHLMSPFAGEGVNLAMIDAADLAKAIIEHPGDIETAFAIYEAGMFPRAREKAAESAANLELAFAPDSPRGFLAFFAGQASAPAQ